MLISPYSDPRLKKQLKVCHFSSDEEAIAAAQTWLDGQTSDFFYWLAKVSLVAVACFLPGRAMDISAPRYVLPTVHLCVLYLTEQIEITYLYSINWFHLISEMLCLYCVVRTEYLNTVLDYPSPSSVKVQSWYCIICFGIVDCICWYELGSVVMFWKWSSL